MPFFSFLSIFVSFSLLADEGFLSRYEGITPFHEHWQSYQIAEDCKGEPTDCIELQDNASLFNQLLEETERRYDERSPSFLNSPLGRRYQSLKNFMHIQNSFRSCRDNAAWGTKKNLGHSLDRLSGNALNPPCYSRNEHLEHPEILKLAEFEQDMQEMEERKLERDLILDSLKRSLEARSLFTQMFGDKGDLCDKIIESHRLRGRGGKQTTIDVCTSKDKALIEDLKKSMDLPSVEPVSTTRVRRELNKIITQINIPLQEYNREKARLKAEWKRKDIGTNTLSPSELGRRQASRKNELKELKKKALENYWNRFAEAHQGKFGPLLQMEAVKGPSNIDKMEELRLKLGLFGAEEKVLKDEDDFASLRPLTTAEVRAAMDEALLRTKNQVQDLLERKKNKAPKGRRDNIAHLMEVNPLSAGYVLRKNPEYADNLCSVAQRLAKRERGRTVGKYGTYLVLGAGIAVGVAASFMTGLSAIPIALGIAAGGGLTAAEYTFHQNDARRLRELQKATLNAYLSNRDGKSVDEMRENWRKILEADAYARATWKFGLLDMIGVTPAVRGVQFVRLARGLKGTINLQLDETRRLVNLISKNGHHVKAINEFAKVNSKEKLGELLNFLATLPKNKQKKLLNAFSSSPKNIVALRESKDIASALNESELLSLRRILTPDEVLERGKRPKRP